MNESKWSAPINQTLIATRVQINNMVIRNLPDDTAQVDVSWSWLNDEGKVIRTGLTRLNENRIDELLHTLGSSVAEMRAMFVAICKAEAEA